MEVGRPIDPARLSESRRLDPSKRMIPRDVKLIQQGKLLNSMTFNPNT